MHLSPLQLDTIQAKTNRSRDDTTRTPGYVIVRLRLVDGDVPKSQHGATMVVVEWLSKL